MTSLRIIKTENDYDLALARMEQIFDAPPNSPEGDEAEVLAMLIENYETEHYQIPHPDPIEAIKIRMEEMSLRQKDLIDHMGSRSIVSEVLNKKRRLTLQMIRNLSARLNLGTDLLIQEYDLITSV